MIAHAILHKDGKRLRRVMDIRRGRKLIPGERTRFQKGVWTVVAVGFEGTHGIPVVHLKP